MASITRLSNDGLHFIIEVVLLGAAQPRKNWCIKYLN